MLFKVFIIASLYLAITSQTTYAVTDKVVCFHASWAGYRPGEGSFKPSNINATLCSHVNYAFLGVASDGKIQILDEWNEVDLGGLNGVAGLKTINPDLKVLISIGGWNAGHEILSGIAASSVLRKSLIDSSIAFFKQWEYDGLDIDWEFPQVADKENFVTLLQELKEAYDEEGYILTVTASAAPTPAYDIPAIFELVDLVNLMTYDFHGAYDGATGYNAPLYASRNDLSDLNVNASVTNWLDAGADPEKLTLSLAFYGHSYSLNDDSVNGVGSPASAGIAGPYTQSPGILGFNEICALYSDWERVFDNVTKVPYRVDMNNWVSYDDEESIGLKVQYAVSNNLAGVALWSLDTDDFLGVCGTKHALLQAIHDNLPAGKF